MTSLSPPESIATTPNSVRPKMANKEMNVEMRSLIPPEMNATIANSVLPKTK